MVSLRTTCFSLVVILAPPLAGCGEDLRDPLNCQFESDFVSITAEGKPAADVAFASDFGRAPARMRVRVTKGTPDEFSVRGCGRDTEGREWELGAAFTHLPVPPAYRLDAELVAGVPLSKDSPDLWGELGLCGESGCGVVEKLAFARGWGNVAGNYHVKAYDPERGQFDGEFWARPGEPHAGPPTHVVLRLTWDPADIHRLDDGAGGAAGASGASTP